MVCIAYHFTFSHFWPCRFLLLLLSIFSWDNQTQCSSLWPLLGRCILPSGWGNHQHFSTGTHNQTQWQPVGPVCLTSAQKQPGWVCQSSVLCAWLFIMNGKFCENLAFLRAMITACVCAGMWVRFCLSWLDALLFLPSMSVKEIVRWALELKSTDNDHDILSLFWHFRFLCDATQWSSWQFVIMSDHLSSCVNKLNLFQNRDLLYLVLSETDNCSLCVTIVLILQIVSCQIHSTNGKKCFSHYRQHF